MSLNLPLKRTRVILFTLTTVSSIIAGAAAINALRKSNAKKAASKFTVPSDITISINTSDIENTVIVLFVVTTLLAMQIGNILLILIKDWFRPYWPPRMTHPRNGIAISTRTLGIQTWYIAVNLGAILAVLIPATVFAVHNMPTVTAFMRGIELPDRIVQAAAARLGLVGVYWIHTSVRFVIISNWINVLFTLLATLASLVALSQRKKDIVTKSTSSEREAN